MANLLSTVRDGSASVSMTPENFVYIDRDCEHFKRLIRRIQTLANEVSLQEGWGLGEGNSKMVSAEAVVSRFKTKARGAADQNSVYDVLEQHYRIVEDIQEVHRIARDRMMQADSEFAAQFSELNETLPNKEPVKRTPEEALEALGRLPGVLGDLYGPTSTPTSASPWPGFPWPGASQ